uniref:Uncharacterized protein n=1 Tax=Anguilla anguilla TaxID=7936 RepID=A0A0E9PQ31_ANGAN
MRPTALYFLTIRLVS